MMGFLCCLDIPDNKEKADLPRKKCRMGNAQCHRAGLRAYAIGTGVASNPQKHLFARNEVARADAKVS